VLFGDFTGTQLPRYVAKHLEANSAVHRAGIVTHDSVEELLGCLKFPRIPEGQGFDAQVLGPVSEARSVQALFKLIPGATIPTRIPKPVG
jgi:hypothetical protein